MIRSYEEMTDDELLTRFEDCTLEPAAFHHLEHVRVAWVILTRMPFDDAEARFIESLKRFATAAGSLGKYDDALTRRYVRLIHERMRPADTWPDFVRENADLLVWPPARTG